MSERLDYGSIAPNGMAALTSVSTYVAKSGLRKALLDLVYLRVSQINGCAFCIDMHSRDLLKDGFSSDKLALVSVWREGGELFSSREQALWPGAKLSLEWLKLAFLIVITRQQKPSFQTKK